MPLLTMIPVSITKPMREMTLISMPHSSSAMNPPVKASGMVNMTIKGDFRLWNWATITRYTSRMPRTSINSSCCTASMIVSFSPVNV